MKQILHLSLLVAISMFVTIAVASCSTDREQNKKIGHEIVSQMQSDLDSLKIDSISAHVIYIQPQIDITDSNQSIFANGNLVPLMGVILGIIVPFVSGVILIFLILKYRRNRHLDRYRLIEQSFANHQPLPDSFYDDYRYCNKLHSGIIWIGWGIAIMLFFTCTGDIEIMTLGIIPAFIGIAHIVTYVVERRKKSDNVCDRSDVDQD